MQERVNPRERRRQRATAGALNRRSPARVVHARAGGPSPRRPGRSLRAERFVQPGAGAQEARAGTGRPFRRLCEWVCGGKHLGARLVRGTLAVRQDIAPTGLVSRLHTYVVCAGGKSRASCWASTVNAWPCPCFFSKRASDCWPAGGLRRPSPAAGVLLRCARIRPPGENAPPGSLTALP